MICPVCGGDRHRRLHDFREVQLSYGISGTVERCGDCGMLFKSFEGDALSVYLDEHPESATAYFASESARHHYRRVLEGSRFLGTPGARLLDVGAGTGALLEVACELGFDGSGIEPNADRAERARRRGFHIHAEAAETARLEGSFDVITMLDLIEHVPHPLQLLETLCAHLAPGGEMIVYTPNHAAPIVRAARLLGRLGVRAPLERIFASNHVCFFDSRTLRTALERVGLSIRRTVLEPYDPRRPGEPIGAVALAAIALIEHLGHALSGSGFRLLVYADAVTAPGPARPA